MAGSVGNHPDKFWIDLNQKVEAAKAAGQTKLSILNAAGVRGNAYSYHCIRLGLKRIGGNVKANKGSTKKMNGKFIDITAVKEPTVEIAYKGATIILRNPTADAIKQVLSVLEE